MALRGVKPTAVKKRLKVFFYGRAGVGKTRAAIQFPRPYLIDTERGSEHEQYIEILNKQEGAYFFTSDIDEIIDEVKALLSVKHNYKTVIIDPLTVPYNATVDRAAEDIGTEFGRHKIPADRKIKHLLTLLLRLDMNVIITSHSKSKWSRGRDAKGKETIFEDGSTFDCYGRLDYLFDLVFEVDKRNNVRHAIIKKSRIEAFKEGEQFPFSYDAIADMYGREILEKDAVPQLLATLEQVNEINRLIDLLKVPSETVQKWLDKNESNDWGEMKAEIVQKYIGSLLNKLNGLEEKRNENQLPSL